MISVHRPDILEEGLLTMELLGRGDYCIGTSVTHFQVVSFVYIIY